MLPITPFASILPQADTAVLYIHGILGTPEHFHAFFPLAKQFSQYSILLDGHGGNAKDFAKTSMAKWKSQVDSKIKELLATHKYIILVAHSMGTLFAISASIRYAVRVKGIFLMNVPLKVRIKPSLFGNCWKVFWNKARPEDVQAIAAQKAYGIGCDCKIWRYLGWIPRYLELFREIRTVRQQISSISVPCLVFLSTQDEMVSISSADFWGEYPYVELNKIPESTHFYYSPQDMDLMLHKFSTFISDCVGAGTAQ